MRYGSYILKITEQINDFYTSMNSIISRYKEPTQNSKGPVLFPPSPSGDPSQTSGVVVGASGYGFVPPGSQGKPYGR
ncbi:hypothetical protein SFRURICE_011291 [Spodoptera frugiperda]|nr:hypothetical protein SFRURICE_011291 [Spodoptera frugiperda]